MIATRIAVLALFSSLVSCTTATSPQAKAYAPTCPATHTNNDVETVILLLECQQKAEAKLQARLGAGNGNAELNKIYLQLLETDNELDFGLTSALKFAESGDPTAVIAVMHIAEKYKIESLDEVIYKLSARSIASESPYPVLSEYLKYILNKSNPPAGVKEKYQQLINMSQARLSVEDLKSIEMLRGSLELKLQGSNS